MPSRPKSEKRRLDVLVVERGLAESREKAQAMILAGEVRVNGARSDKAGVQIAADAHIEISGASPKYASRGGLKLDGALTDFGIDASGKTCLDIGSSTGGFTDCLLQHGARHVYAVDVTPEQMAWRLHQDPRVTRIQENARNLRPEQIPESIDLVTVDVSFISVAKVLPAVAAASGLAAEFLILIKPQFELDRGDIGSGGIVRDAALHRRAIERVRDAALACGLTLIGDTNGATDGEGRGVMDGVRPSHITGAEGNREFFLHARKKPR
ncbi:MAG TPA: TlyA family RNA methyltransferase [Candidatus Dormibacteraeota bacterium]|nr:TlyA family RNA methyltransferase [Candidatus Dormibacteraeota bacterium]